MFDARGNGACLEVYVATLCEDGETRAEPMQTVEPTTQTKTLTLSGELTVAGARALCERLQPAAADDTALAIDAEGVARVDTSALQLLAALVRERAAADRETIWTAVAAPLRDAARIAGLVDALGVGEENREQETHR